MAYIELDRPDPSVIYISRREAMLLLKIEKDTLRRLVHKNIINAYVIDRFTVYLKEDIEKLIGHPFNYEDIPDTTFIRRREEQLHKQSRNRRSEERIKREASNNIPF